MNLKKNIGTIFENQSKKYEMKNIYLTFFLFCSITIYGQKVDYDNSSKWFWGLNLGGTWQTTDVSNKTSVGWGIIVGKSFNYNYGKPFSFDLRGRYLNGNWYGQDTDSTILTGLSEGANALYNYQNGLGYTYHNFKSNVHRFALELAIHLNALTEKTGLDPYIFGGVGLTWNRTYGNLTDSSNILSGPTQYNYQPNGINTINFDNSYETALDGYSKYRVNFMPSLGFGLGYHIGKRTTLGFEHKTTFTLKDNFDAVQSSIPRSKNDLYHYTSLYLRFRLRGSGSSGGSTSNNNVDNTSSNCPVPVISILSQNNTTINQASVQVKAKITEVSSSNSISLIAANNQSFPFIYNSVTKNFEATVTLTPGANTFRITATNNCGSDSETITLNYVNCNLPSGNFTNPMNSQVSVTNPNYSISALVVGVQNASNLAIYQNGNKLNNPSYNINSGVVQANVILQPGVNTFKMDLTNSCGSSNISTSVNYNNCISPNIQFTSPSASGSTVNTSSYTINAKVSNLSSGSLIVTVNGVNITNFTNNNVELQIPVNLNNGNNTITIRATNNCGTDSETTTLNYQRCNAPLISVSQPVMNSIANVPTSYLKAKVENVGSKQDIQILLNNINVPVFNFNTATKMVDATLNLLQGNNTITISSSNTCGSDIETIIVAYDNCKAPVVDITNVTNQTVILSAYTLNATIQNMPASDGLVLTQNGLPINYTFLNGLLSSSVSLIPGTNTFKLSATRTCGNSSETIVVNYNDCISPTVNIINPAASGVTVNNTSFNFKAFTNNISNNQQVSFKFNGLNHPFTFYNGQIEATVNLINGNNAFSVTVTNLCGTETKNSSINLVNCFPPEIVSVNPNNNSATVTSATFNYQATITGVSNANAITFKQNGQIKPFTFSNGTLNSSLSLISGNNNVTVSVTNDCGVDIEAVIVNYDNCAPPIISFTNPTQLNLTTSNSLFNITAQLSNSMSQGITLTQNGITKEFSFSNSNFSASLNLIPGNNTIAISTHNSCGNDIKFINVTYNNCAAPVVVITEPNISGNTVNTSAFNFQASVQNMPNLQGIVLTHNGNTITGVTFNNGVLMAPVNLSQGLNTFSISANNACGNATQTTTVNYNNCTAPVLTMNNPSVGNSTVNSPNYNLNLSATNISSSQELIVTHNGGQLSNVIFSNGQITANVTLSAGANSFYVNASNGCGSDTKTFTVNYDNCIPPVVTIINSNNPNQPIINANYQFSATVQHINSTQGIQLKLNGNIIQNIIFSGNELTANVVLSPGSNIFILDVQNNCGSDNETFIVNYENCSTPVIHVNTTPISGTTTNNSQLSFVAQVLNYNSNTIVNLSLNGLPVNTFSNVNGSISFLVNLTLGTNNISISVLNACGRDAANYLINYQLASNSGSNSINGNGNNADGVDSSNPGQGSGGPNGQTDTNNGSNTPTNNQNNGNSNLTPKKNGTTKATQNANKSSVNKQTPTNNTNKNAVKTESKKETPKETPKKNTSDTLKNNNLTPLTNPTIKQNKPNNKGGGK
jgi:hypothetical protein